MKIYKLYGSNIKTQYFESEKAAKIAKIKAILKSRLNERSNIHIMSEEISENLLPYYLLPF